MLCFSLTLDSVSTASHLRLARAQKASAALPLMLSGQDYTTRHMSRQTLLYLVE
jgi:hypothetical protein